MTIRKWEEIPVHFKKQAQIEAKDHNNTQAQSKAQVGFLIFNKAPTKISVEYSDYNNVFLAENAKKLSKNTRMNEHTIKLEESKQPLFRPIYNLGPVELETLKTYIKINLANGFIQPSKSPAGALIPFDQKLDGSLYLYVDYWKLNNITIKN